MIRTFLLTSFVVLQMLAIAQSLGDYRSAVAIGEWTINSSWERFDGTSWVPALVSPNSFDGVITIQAGHTITLPSDEILDQIVVNGTLRISNTADLTFPASVSSDVITVNGTLENFGTIAQTAPTIIRVNGTYIARQGSTLTGSTASNLFFQAGSTYQHNYTTTAGTIPIATWSPTSTLLFSGSTSYLSAPGNLGQSFGNVTFNMTQPGGTGTLNLAGLLTTVNGNFTTTSTNARAIQLVGAAPYTLNVGGNFSIGGGAINLNVVEVDALINIAQNFTWTAGSITKAGNGTATLSFNGSGVQTFSNTTHLLFAGGIRFAVQSGSTLDLGESSITGTTGSAFTLHSGATLRLGSTNSSGALVNSSTLGNIRVPAASRTYESGSTIVYNGNALQFIGNAHPTGAGITTIIDNANDVKLASDAIINGDLILEQGNLNIESVDLTIGGDFISNSNFLVASGNTELVINNTSSSSDVSLRLSNTSSLGLLQIGQASLTTGRTVRLEGDLTVLNNVALYNGGNLVLNGFNLTLQGGIIHGGGTLTSNANSSITIAEGGAGFLPADLLIEGGAINAITVNRIGEVFATSSDLDVNNLNLLAGEFTHTGTIRITDNGIIRIGSGILTNPVEAISVYNVEYNGFEDVATGAELIPASGNVLDVVNQSLASVSLSSDITITGSLLLQDGIFYDTAYQITLNGDLLSNGATNFAGNANIGTIAFNGNTLISGSIIPQLGNVVINNSASVIVDQDLQVNVAGDFTTNGTFTSQQSTILLNGEGDQFLSGSSPVSFYRLEIEKNTPSEVTIQSPVDIIDLLSIRTETILNAGNELLRLVSNASRTARVNPIPDNADIIGSVIVQRYIPNNVPVPVYRYVATPVIDTFVSDWQSENPITGTFANPSLGLSIPSLYYYDETNVAAGPALEDRYRNYPSSGNSNAAPLINGLGYSMYIFTPGPTTIDSRGTLAQHQIVTNVTAQNNSAVDGWNLIGNPYPSPILWGKVTLSPEVEDALYIRANTAGTATGFATYIDGIGVPSGFAGIIDMGQAFWVHATANGTVTFDESDKVISTDSTGQFYRENTNSTLVRVFLTGSDGQDEIAIRFKDQATDNFDKKYDALKLPGSGINLASKSLDGKDLTINTFGALDCNKMIPLSMSNLKPGTHTFRIEGIDDFEDDVMIELVDMEKSVSVDLRLENEYDFEVTDENIGSASSRFVLKIEKSRLFKDLAVSNSVVCFTEASSKFSVQNTQYGVSYKASLNGTDVSEWVNGNGGTIEFEVPVNNLTVGETAFKISLKNACFEESLTANPIITKLRKPEVSKTVDAIVCQPGGEATLQASGAVSSEVYNWYLKENDTQPYATSTSGLLEIQNLNKTSTYYVSLENSLGCESERLPVKAEVVQFEDARISLIEENILLSNYETGNQWYFNGSLIDDETDRSVKADRSGTYAVEVSVSGCTTSAQYDFITTSSEMFEASGLIDVFPNPVTKDLFIKVNGPSFKINHAVLTDVRGSKIKEISIVDGMGVSDIQELPEGYYLLHISSDSGKRLSFRVVKK